MSLHFAYRGLRPGAETEAQQCNINLKRLVILGVANGYKNLTKNQGFFFNVKSREDRMQADVKMISYR